MRRKTTFFIYLFTSFSGHKLAQRKCARTLVGGITLKCRTLKLSYTIYLCRVTRPQHSEQLFWTQACPEEMCTNGTQVPCEVPSLPNLTTRKGWPHHRGLRTLLFSKRDVGSFTSHKSKSGKVLWDGTHGFSSLSEKTRKSNHLQMSLQRQHFLLSYLRTQSVGPGFEPATSHSVDRHSPNWANQAAVRFHGRTFRFHGRCLSSPYVLSVTGAVFQYFYRFQQRHGFHMIFLGTRQDTIVWIFFFPNNSLWWKLALYVCPGTGGRGAFD